MALALVVIALVLMMLLSGCQTFKAAQTTETVTVTERDTLIIRPMAQVDTVIKWKTLRIDYPYIIEDSSSRVQLRLLRNDYGQLLASARVKPETLTIKLRDTVKLVETRTVPIERIAERKKEPGRRIAWYWILAIVAVSISLALIGLGYALKPFR